MESNLPTLDINSTTDEVQRYLDRFNICINTKNSREDYLIKAYFLTAVGKQAYILIETLV